jgi:hypothetical protein
MQKPVVINPHLPIRDRIDPITGDRLLFATMPQSIMTQRYVVTHPWNMKTQARLYRTVRSGEFPNHAAIKEIWEWIFYDLPEISKKMMGGAVTRTTLYNPRRLKGITKDNDQAKVMYSFNNMLELQYGLEWMICTWLRKFLNDDVARRAIDRVHGPERMSEELDILAFTSEREYKALYESQYDETKFTDPNWMELTKGFNEREYLSERPKTTTRPGPPVSLN